MSEITQLEPKLLWKWFDQICQIPHPSYEEDKIANFIVDWAKDKGFFVERDAVGNVLIRKPATKGMENRPSVVLQAHLDMVPQANEDTVHNFSTDPIRPYIDGEWVTAEGTTLGADNGIGMASTLAILESDDLAHPELEVLLTMTEERGMEGALGLQPNWLKSKIMINTDTEENAEIYIGCAGGENANLLLPIERENNRFEHSYRITLKGLCGGHSGCDIHKNRGNAIKLMARFLAEFKQQHTEFDFALSDFRGGSIRNAIPRESFADVVFNGDIAEFETAVVDFANILKAEYELTESNLLFIAEQIEKPAQTFNNYTTHNVIDCLNIIPNGVVRQSDAVENTVETSLSLGVVTTEDDVLKGTILIRSLIESGKEAVKSDLRSVARLVQGEILFSGDYPGWAPETHSPLLELTKEIYENILGYAPAIKVIHAGLECGLLKKIYPNLDVVSIGPTIRNAHSPDEKVNIEAVEIYWNLLTKMLANIKAN